MIFSHQCGSLITIYAYGLLIWVLAYQYGLSNVVCALAVLWESNFCYMQGLWDSTHRATIGVKRMGDLDQKPFQIATKEKYSIEEADEKAVEFCSLWEEYLRHPNWHPFKIITDQEGKPKVYIQ